MERDTESEVSRRTMLQTAGATGTAALGLAGCVGGGGGGGSGNSSGNSDSGNNSSNSTGGGSDAPLEALHGWTGGDGANAIEALAENFKDEHPDMAANFKAIGGGGNVNLNSRVAQRLANNNSPSSFAGWPGANLTKYEGVLMDVESAWDQANLKDVMLDPAEQACQFNGSYVAVPIGSHRMNNLYFNKQVVSDAGVDPSSLNGVEGLIDALTKVQENTDKVPLAKGMKSPFLSIGFWVQVFLSQAGTSAYMDLIEGNGDKQQVAQSLQTTKTILSNYINQDASTVGYTEANQKLISGGAAMIHNGNWLYGMYRSAEDFAYGDDWGWAPFPGTGGTYMFHLDSFIAPANNPTPQKTNTWEQYVGSKEAQIEFNKRKGSVPLRNDIDPNKLPEYLKITYNDLLEAEGLPPTMAHGLAVPPQTLGNIKSVFGDNFMGPYKVDATAEGLLQAIQGDA